MQVGSLRRALLAGPPRKLRTTLHCLHDVLWNETTARRGGLGSFDGIEDGCSGLQSAAEVSHASEVPRDAGASRGLASEFSAARILGGLEATVQKIRGYSRKT